MEQHVIKLSIGLLLLGSLGVYQLYKFNEKVEATSNEWEISKINGRYTGAKTTIYWLKDGSKTTAPFFPPLIITLNVFMQPFLLAIYLFE